MKYRNSVLIVLALSLTASASFNVFAATLEEIANGVVGAIRSGDGKAFARDFTPQLRKTLTPQMVEQLLRQLKSEAGALAAVGKPQRNSANTATYPLEFEKDALNLQLTLVDGKLGGIHLLPGGTPASPAAVENVAANIEAALRKRDAAMFARDFSPELTRALSREAVIEIFRDLYEKYGPFEARGELSQPQPRLAVYPMTFARGTLNLVLTVGTNGKVQGVHFTPHRS